MREPILGRPQWLTVGVLAVVQAAVTLGLFLWALPGRGLEQARNLAFAALVLGELFRAFAARSATLGLLSQQPRVNRVLLSVVLGSAVIQVAMTHVAWSRGVFHLYPLSRVDVALCVALGLIPMLASEALKAFSRARRHARGT